MFFVSTRISETVFVPTSDEKPTIQATKPPEITGITIITVRMRPELDQSVFNIKLSRGTTVLCKMLPDELACYRLIILVPPFSTSSASLPCSDKLNAGQTGHDLELQVRDAEGDNSQVVVLNDVGQRDAKDGHVRGHRHSDAVRVQGRNSMLGSKYCVEWCRQ